MGWEENCNRIIYMDNKERASDQTGRKKGYVKVPGLYLFAAIPLFLLACFGADQAGEYYGKNILPFKEAPIIDYRVQKGDTLTKIAEAEGLSDDDIKRYIKRAIADNRDNLVRSDGNWRPAIDSDGRLWEGTDVKLRDMKDGGIGN